MIDFAGDGALISECMAYRWRLDRHVGGTGAVAAVFGVNPSTADASIDDNTVRKWRGFGQRLGWQRFIVGNAFALRATDVRCLAKAGDPVGRENYGHLDRIIDEADLLIPCWGDRGKLPRSLQPHLDHLLACLHISGKPVLCWGQTASGDPRHPLMLAYATPLAALSERVMAPD